MAEFKTKEPIRQARDLLVSFAVKSPKGFYWTGHENINAVSLAARLVSREYLSA